MKLRENYHDLMAGFRGEQHTQQRLLCQDVRQLGCSITLSIQAACLSCSATSCGNMRHATGLAHI